MSEVGTRAAESEILPGHPGTKMDPREPLSSPGPSGPSRSVGDLICLVPDRSDPERDRVTFASRELRSAQTRHAGSSRGSA